MRRHYIYIHKFGAEIDRRLVKWRRHVMSFNTFVTS